MFSRSRTAGIALATSSVLVLAVACTGDDDTGAANASSPAADPADVALQAPADPLTVLGDPNPAAAAVAASALLFARSDVAVLARDGDRAGELLGASAAVGLGVPLLLEPADGSDDALTDELDRLGVATLLAVGQASGEDIGPDVVAVPADVDAVEDATGLELGEADPVADDAAVAAVAALDPDEPVALVSEEGRPEDTGSAESDSAEPDSAESDRAGAPDALPAVIRAEPLPDTVVISTGLAESVAAAATVRAAGAAVQVTEGADPRGSAELGALLADRTPAHVVALGADLAAEPGLDWKIATAATGTQLPGGGQLIFPAHLLIALYGSPGTPSLGVLGEQDPAASVQRARDTAAPYEGLVDRTVVPTFEIIATVASAEPGADGDYSAELDVADLRPLVDAAGQAGIYVVLDLQPGRTDFVTQAQRYAELLALPNVGLALDPEWRLEPNEQHLVSVGSVDVEEVNRVVSWLADLTRENALPQKLLVLHQFRADMIAGRERLDLSRDELAVLVHADGQGGQAEKQATWANLHAGAPPVWWGWKNFYDEDAPMLTPEQTVAQVSPVPDLVSYQ